MRRRIRLRTTAPPSAFFTLVAPSEVLNGREAMTTLLTARRQNFAAPFCLHPGTEAMRLMAPPHFGLKGTFRQRDSSQQAASRLAMRQRRHCAYKFRRSEPVKHLVYATVRGRSRRLGDRS
jgi:hypothetical protein